MKSSKVETVTTSAGVSTSAPSGYLSNSPVHTLFACCLPVAILATFVLLLRQLLGEELALSFAVLFPIAGCVFGALTASLYCDFMKDVKSSKTAATIRGGIIVLAISYAAASLFNLGMPWSEIFLPSVSNITAAVGAFYAWESVIALKKLFNSRKRFIEYTEQYQGEKLKEFIYGEAGTLLNTNSETVSAKKYYLIQLAIIAVMLLINTGFKNHIPLFLYLLLIGILLGGVCLLGFFGIFNREQYHAGEGLTVSPFDRVTHILGMGIFSALCVVVAALLSTGKNLLRISWIGNFFKWFFGLFRRPPRPVEQLPPPDTDYMPPPLDFGEAFSDILGEAHDPSPIWTYLKYALIALAALGFIWFMIEPLLNRGKRRKKITTREKLLRTIAEWLRGIARGLVSFFTALRYGGTWRKIRKPSAGEIKDMADSLMGAYAKAKKSDIRQSATLFARLIIWGSEVRQMLWKPSHAPGEYCALLSASAPPVPPPADILNSQNKNIIRCGELFERALYSAEVLSYAEKKEFRHLIEKITDSDQSELDDADLEQTKSD